ncbi:MAG: hypothetical protein LPJ89_04145, partial [Hymenobacteraceae bacterium]|nr:hypothetical protein [Hymenobacteraceae bacterium]MDX5395981.1 hypothetical protein [Hymenobacteraceae bacterium]MDX5442955.1 hypothetical protein [Hymenobacteraceae bacterium]MDX5512042.1 hypothetical protein [Hymenobacteraceae bacterium]
RDDVDEDDYEREPRHHHEEGFLDRLGDKISHAWDRLTGHHEADYEHRHRSYDVDRHARQHRHHEHERMHERKFNRGYESGPRWADESSAIDPYRHHSSNENLGRQQRYNRGHENDRW